MPSPPSIPDHTLLRPIGRGAYGEVWLARNVMGTPRAVKIIWRRQFESDRPYDREFAGIQDYEPVSRTSDGLMQVLHVGRNDARGYFYYVMELADDERAEKAIIKGENGKGSPTPIYPFSPERYSPHTLRSDLNRLGSMPIADCLRIALDLVTGLACLHRHGLVHRDVKPGNIIFVNGRAKLADIGLVSTHNEGRTFVGTEGYIPPEGPGSPAADLYALGMVLYEAATGQLPERFPRTPVEWFAGGASGERIEFHEIVLKAGEGARERRYQTAEELQKDLALLQSGQSLRRVRALQRRANRSRRLALAAVVAGIVALGSILLSNYRVRVETEQRAREQTWRQEAERARMKAERAERDARHQLLNALTEQARAGVRSGELGQRFRTLDAVRRAAGITNSPELRQAALAALVLPDLRFEGEIALPSDVTLASLDPEFRRVAIGRGANDVVIRSMADNSVVAELPATIQQSAQGANWSNDGKWVAITRAAEPLAWQANVEVWEVESARRLLTLPPTRYGACSFHPHLPLLLGAQGEDSVALWNLTDGRETARYAVTGQVHHVMFSPDGESFVAQHRVGKSWFTSVLKTSTGVVSSSKPSGWIDAIAWHPQDKFVALASRQGDVYLHDRKTGETSILGRHKNEARAAVFSPDGGFLFTGGEEQEVICWDLATRQRAFGFTSRGAQIQFAGTGARCAIMTRAGLRLHEFVRPTACRDLPVDLGPTVRHAAFSSDGRWLAAGGLSGLGVWDLASDASPLVLPKVEHATPFFSPRGSELFAYSMEELKRWRLEEGTPQPRADPVPGPEADRVRAGRFVGESLLLGVRGGLDILSAIDLGAPRKHIPGGYVASLSSSSDGKWASVQKVTSIELFRVDQAAWSARIMPGPEILTHAFVPRGDELAVVTSSALAFFHVGDWKTRREFPVALDRRARILFAPDGRSFWLIHDARTAALYDADSFAMLVPLAPGVLPLAVSPDGTHVLVSIDGRRLQLWNWTLLRRELEELGLGWSSL